MSAAVAVDVVVLTLDREKVDQGEEQARLRFLAVRRREPPYQGRWSLPGRIVGDDEELDDAALTALTRDADVSGMRHVEQLATFGAPGRDPRGRVVSVTYLGLLPRPLETTDEARWLPVGDAGELGFDHADILDAGLARLRSKLGYSNVAYGLLPDEFTLSELQEVYEAVMGATLDKRNFRKKVLGLGLVIETERFRRGAHRPAQLYRFTQPELVTIDAAAIA